MSCARALAGLALASACALAAVVAGCPGTLSLEEKQHLAYDCPDVPSVLLARHCATAGCHDAASMAGGLDLASPKLALRLVGVPANGGGALIDLRDPESSVLLTKLGDRPPFGARMPAGRPPIDAASYACVHAWVLSFVPVTTPVDDGTQDAGDDADAPDVTSDAADAAEVDASDATDAAQDVDATDSASGAPDGD